jgi:hypothetical protein
MADAPDSNALLNAVLPFAQQMLAKHGEFLPFGATMNRDGEVALSASMPASENEQEVLAMLVSAHRQRAGEGAIKGSAICYNARVSMAGRSEKQDAICVELEHVSERCAQLFVPYQKRLLRGFRYGELFGSFLEPKVFGGSSAG